MHGANNSGIGDDSGTIYVMIMVIWLSLKPVQVRNDQ
jgi:hypothetical protein